MGFNFPGLDFDSDSEGGGGGRGGSEGGNPHNNPAGVNPPRQQTFNVGLGPTFMGTVTVLENNEVHSKKLASDGQMVHGTTVMLGYKDNSSGYVDFEWIQTVRLTVGGKKSIFNDPRYRKDNGFPFYYTADEYDDPKRIPKDYDEYFFDGPFRHESSIAQKFEAELSLVGRTKNWHICAINNFNI